MNKEIFSTLKKEIIYLAITLILSIIFFKIIFYKESFWIIIKTVLALFFVFIMPGYCILSYWYKEIHFFERMTIGMAIGAGTTAMFGYYLGVLGINLKYLAFILPSIFIILGIIAAIYRKNETETP